MKVGVVTEAELVDRTPIPSTLASTLANHWLYPSTTMLPPLLRQPKGTQTQPSTVTTFVLRPKPDLLHHSLKASIRYVNSRLRRHSRTLSLQTRTKSPMTNALFVAWQIPIGSIGFSAPSSRVEVGPTHSAPVSSPFAKPMHPRLSSAFCVAGGRLPVFRGCQALSPPLLHFSGGRDRPFATHRLPRAAVGGG